MKRITGVIEELIGLFVEDGSLAMAIVIWLCFVAFLLPHVPGGLSWRAPVLFLGLALLLFENVLRTARKP
jgi:hypothetical protein